MAWGKLDDGILDHPKFLALLADAELTPVESLAAIGLWTEANAYCERHMTDGFLPFKALEGLVAARGKSANREALASKLAGSLIRAKGHSDVGLLEPADGGYVIHDFLDWHRSKDERQALTRKRREAGQKGGQRSGEVRQPSTNEANHEAHASSADRHQRSKIEAEKIEKKEKSNPRSGKEASASHETPPEAFRVDCPELRWRGCCVDPTWVRNHPGAHYPTSDANGTPKQCPHHRSESRHP